MEVSAQQIQNKLSLVLLIILNTSFVFAQNPSIQVEMDFSQIQGVSAGKETFTLELGDSRLESSPLTMRMKSLLMQSSYQNISFKNLSFFFVNDFIDQIENLCLIHKKLDKDCKRNNTNYLFGEIEAFMAQRLTDNFLYPDHYHPIGTLPSNIIQKANSTSCCYDQDIAKTILYGSSSQHDQIITKLRDSGTSCLKQAGHAVIENLQSHTVYEQYDHPSFCKYVTTTLRSNKTRCHQLQNDYKIIQERITDLTNLIRENETPLTYRSSACLENIANNNSLTSQISLFKQDLEDHQSCGDYGIGEERIKSSAGHGGKGYIIKRESDDAYTASLFIEFVPGPFYGNENIPIDQVQNHYRQRVQACIDRANPYLKGPNGQDINIVIRTPGTNTCVPKNTITIWNTERNAQMLNYPSDLNDCSVITHEILHLLALGDEYRGTNPYHPSVQFRGCSMWEENSIMNNTRNRWTNVFDSKTETSLLDPTHFNVILYRGCSKRDDVRLYSECERELPQTIYKSSCREKRLYCKNILGRNKSRELQRIDQMLQELRLRQQNGEFDSANSTLGGQREIEGIYSKFLDSNPHHTIQILENRRRVVASWPDN